MYNTPSAFITERLFTIKHPDIATLVVCMHTAFVVEDEVMDLFTQLEFWRDRGLHIITLISVAIPIEQISLMDIQWVNCSREYFFLHVINEHPSSFNHIWPFMAINVHAFLDPAQFESKFGQPMNSSNLAD